MTLAELSQRLRRADFLDGVGIYVGAHEVALAHVRKKFFTVSLRHARTFPLPPASRPVERRQALTQAVAAFAREHDVNVSRAYLCVPRAEAAFSRVILPAAARENLGQVLEYEVEHLVPLPRDQVHFDYSMRPIGTDRLEVLVACIPREIVRTYLEALEEAFVRPRGIVLASTAIADYLAFCRGGAEGPVALLVGAGEGVEVALVVGGRLVASQLVPPQRLTGAADLSRSLARQLADGALTPEDVHLYRWQLANGGGPALPALGDGDLLNLAAGKLEAPREFFETTETAILPAVGAALDAVREGTVPVNLLPEEGRRADEGLSVATVFLFGAAIVLAIFWGISGIVKDVMLRNQVEAQIAELAPQVKEVRAIQAEIDDLTRQLDVLRGAQGRRVTEVLKELSDLIPTDGYLTAFNLRNDRVTLEGQARSFSEILAALEKSKRFKEVKSVSPTTRIGDKERFSIQAEVRGEGGK